MVEFWENYLNSHLAHILDFLYCYQRINLTRVHFLCFDAVLCWEDMFCWHLSLYSLPFELAKSYSDTGWLRKKNDTIVYGKLHGHSKGIDWGAFTIHWIHNLHHIAGKVQTAGRSRLCVMICVAFCHSNSCIAALIL